MVFPLTNAVTNVSTGMFDFCDHVTTFAVGPLELDVILAKKGCRPLLLATALCVTTAPAPALPLTPPPELDFLDAEPPAATEFASLTAPFDSAPALTVAVKSDAPPRSIGICKYRRLKK
jgi:hypothetical protein